MLPINQIICGNCLEVMKTFPDNSIDTVIYSPPYYGLRTYGKETETIWEIAEQQKQCKHEFIQIKEDVEGYTDRKRWQHGINRETDPDKWNRQIKEYSYCIKCNAWKGQLGLEPNWKMYIEHLVLINKEIYRILKKEGSLYINIGDTYAGQKGGGPDKCVVAAKLNRNFIGIELNPKYVEIAKERVAPYVKKIDEFIEGV